MRSPFLVGCLTNTEVLVFLTGRGVNPLENLWFGRWELTEEIIRTDPFEAQVALRLDGDTLRLTVDETFSVGDVTIGGL